MKIVGNVNHEYQVETNACGVKQIYTFPTEESMIKGCRLYKQLFPMIKIKVVRTPN